MKGRITGFSTAIIVATCTFAFAQTAAPPAPSVAAESAQIRTPQHTTTAGKYGRFDITAIPLGALWVRSGDTDAEAPFDNYSPGAAVAMRLTHNLNVEGETAWGVGRTQNLKFGDGTEARFKTPNMFGYSGNVMLNLLPIERRIVPYAIGGIGGLHVSSRDDLGVDSSNFLTGDIGGGVKVMWHQFGIRGDYRFFAMHGNDDESSPFVGTDTRAGNRVYAGFVFAPGRQSIE